MNYHLTMKKLHLCQGAANFCMIILTVYVDGENILVKDLLVGSLFYTVFENVPFCSGCFELAVATFCFQIARGKPQKPSWSHTERPNLLLLVRQCQCQSDNWGSTSWHWAVRFLHSQLSILSHLSKQICFLTWKNPNLTRQKGWSNVDAAAWRDMSSTMWKLQIGGPKEATAFGLSRVSLDIFF